MPQQMPRRRFRDVIRGRRRLSRQQPARLVAGIEALERRDLLATNVLTFRNDLAGNGVNAAEQQLTPANVKVGSFGKIYATAVDGQVYAQPLVQTGVTIVAGPNTTPGSTGLRDVVFVATQNDTLYAIDASNAGGAVLWKRSFTDITAGNVGTVPGTNINNTLSATAITPVPYADLGTGDISPIVGITGTPVIDATTGTLYVSAKTKETIGGVAHYVSRLHAISVADGTDKAVPYLVGDTSGTNTNNTQIYVYGSGDGAITDPYNGTGKQVVQFNALRANQRAALSLVGNTLYVSWASHGDNGPYHGWVTAWDVGNLTTTGFRLSGVLNTSPNGGLAGIWQAGGKLSFEPDGSAFYFETGNGPSNAGAPVLNAAGFPADASYYEALVKAVPDATTSPTNQNANGWGFRVADYFIPYNQTALDSTDQDFGSGAPLILPDSAGIPGHPRLLVASGKEGKIYVVDRDNLGKFNAINDNVLNAVPDGTGHKTPPIQLGGSVSTPSYFNGRLYWVSGFNSRALSYRINSDGTLTIMSSTGSTFFGYLPGSVSISANGTGNGIVWIPDRNTNALRAYDSATLSTELWNSGQQPADAAGALVKFAVPTVANGKVYVGTTNGLVVYGLTPPAVSVPAAPVLAASTLSGTSVSLSWTDPTVSPNLATGYAIERLINGVYQQVTTAPAGATNISIGGLSTLTSYSFRIRGFNSLGNSAYSNVAAVTTNDFVPVVDFSGGFAGSTTKLTYNGSAVISGTRARLTSGSTYQRGSVFTTSPVDVTRFRSSFQFEVPLGSNTADGFTFTLQGVGPTALGSFGGGLGYGPDGANSPAAIGRSVAVKFDLANNSGEGNNSTGLYVNGAAPTGAGSIDLTAAGVDLHSGNVFLATLAYDGTKLSVTITDTVTGRSASQSYTVDIVANAGASAYVGFSAGTGAATAIQDIVDWTYSPNVPQAPAAPSGLGAVPASATSVALSWTNNATNQTGFALDRALDAGFTQGLVTQSLPATPSAYTDTLTGLAPGGTFYYRMRATNSAGSSSNSNVTSVTIPLAPAKPSDAAVATVTTSQIDLTWTDNAGRAADGYRILRAVNRGAFELYASLPAFNATPPSTYSWSDTAVQPGTFYQYHIQAFNISGYNDFTGTGVTTLTVAPTPLAATAASNSVSLTWTAPAGAVAYKIYRGTAAGAETLLTTGVATTTYTDTTAVNGTRYYYVVTAVNGNVTPVAAESATSNEVSVIPPANNVPAAPVLAAVALSSTSVLLSWTDATVAPNTATGYFIEQLINGTYQQVATAAAGATAVTVSGLAVQTAYSFRIRGANVLGSSPYSNIATVTTANGVPALDLGAGFAGSTTKLTFNGSAAINGTRARLTSGVTYQAGSFFSFRPVDVTRFNSTFQFQTTGGNTTADGLTFTIQGVGAAALGSFGGGLGYGPDGTNSPAAIGRSVAIKFDLANNSGEGSNSTGLYVNGAAPTSTGSVNLTGSGIDLHSGNVFQVALAYDGSQLTVIITDAVTGRSASQTYTVDIVATAGATAYVGFTAGTGVAVATQEIINWTFSPTAPQYPATPTGLAITAASASSITLGWTNNATNQTGFAVDRATDSGFTRNLVTRTLPATATTLVDTASIAAGTTYYYRIRATNTVGGSSNSTVASARTLTLAPTTLVATAASNSVALRWTAPIGAVAYKVYRGTVAGAATLLNASVATTTYTDATALAGTRYYYVVTAVNGNVAPLTAESLRSNEVSAIPTAAAPTGLTALASGNVGSRQISLSWTAATGATSYKIYRATTSGGQTATPLATLVTGTTFIDKTVKSGVRYYYKVVAVNAGGDSPFSNEATAIA